MWSVWREALEREGVVEIRQRPWAGVGLVAAGLVFVAAGLFLGAAGESRGWGRFAPGMTNLIGWLGVGLGLVGLVNGVRILIRRPLVVRIDRSGLGLPGGRHVKWPAVRAADTEGAAGQARAVVEVDDPDGVIGRRTRGGFRQAPPGVGRIGLRPYHAGTADDLARLIVWARSSFDEAPGR